jgi:hypothetical protein
MTTRSELGASRGAGWWNLAAFEPQPYAGGGTDDAEPHLGVLARDEECRHT